MRYKVNVARGSSGGAAVDIKGKLFALHNAEVKMPAVPPEERLNQGIRIDQIYADFYAGTQRPPIVPPQASQSDMFWSLTDSAQNPQPIIGRTEFRRMVLRIAFHAGATKRRLRAGAPGYMLKRAMITPEKNNRRAFLRTLAASGAALGLSPAQTRQPGKEMIGIHVGAGSFADEGVEQVLDILQERASVNALFLATFTYGRGIAGRQVPGQPLPDHGKQEYDANFRGGSYTKIHAEFYRDTSLKEFRAPELGDFDVLEAVLPAARKRGIRIYCWFEDVFRRDIAGIEKLQERDLYGRGAATLCFNNPEYRGFLLGVVEDYLRSHPVDGIMWGSERQGAFSNALGAQHGGASNDPGRITCFCDFCRRKGEQRGTRFERARQGFLELEKFVRAARSGVRPVDGYYVTLWRLMLRYPELLAWEMLWTDSLRETYQAIYQKVKAINPNAGTGWHIWHNNSFNPIYRAERDLHEIASYSDFLKIVMYHNCAGERMAGYIASVGAAMFADVPKDELLALHYRILDYREKPYEQISSAGFSSDYVSRETQRARSSLEGATTLLWPGIDIDIPTAPEHSKCTPESTKQAVMAAFHAGADGVILSRKYSEMHLSNLGAAGAAIRELG